MNKKMPAIIKGMLLAVGGIVTAIAVLIGSYEAGQKLPADPAFGAIPGDVFEGPITYRPRATTTGATLTALTLTSGDIENFGVFNVLHHGQLTITLPAT